MTKKKNSVLVEPGAKVEFTEEMINELYKCKQNPLYFINKYCYIVHPTEGRIKLTLRDYQENFLNIIHKSRSTIALCIRQSGKCCNYCAKISIKTKNDENKEVTEIGDFFDNL